MSTLRPGKQFRISPGTLFFLPFFSLTHLSLPTAAFCPRTPPRHSFQRSVAWALSSVVRRCEASFGLLQTTSLHCPVNNKKVALASARGVCLAHSFRPLFGPHRYPSLPASRRRYTHDPSNSEGITTSDLTGSRGCTTFCSPRSNDPPSPPLETSCLPGSDYRSA